MIRSVWLDAASRSTGAATAVTHAGRLHRGLINTRAARPTRFIRLRRMLSGAHPTGGLTNAPITHTPGSAPPTTRSSVGGGRRRQKITRLQPERRSKSVSRLSAEPLCCRNADFISHLRWEKRSTLGFLNMLSVLSFNYTSKGFTRGQVWHASCISSATLWRTNARHLSYVAVSWRFSHFKSWIFLFRTQDFVVSHVGSAGLRWGRSSWPPRREHQVKSLALHLRF